MVKAFVLTAPHSDDRRSTDVDPNVTAKTNWPLLPHLSFLVSEDKAKTFW
jgi:hypothetical protein